MQLPQTFRKHKGPGVWSSSGSAERFAAQDARRRSPAAKASPGGGVTCNRSPSPVRTCTSSGPSRCSATGATSVLHLLNDATPPKTIRPLCNYLILRFHEGGYGVVPLQPVDHLSPYLRGCGGIFICQRLEFRSGDGRSAGFPTSTLTAFSSSASRKSSVTGSLNLAVCGEARQFISYTSRIYRRST